MEYTVQKLARLAGVTNCTLRHYHQIGLLLPARISSGGYRIYGPREVDRLQQILFYRELGFELAEIKAVLDNPAFDARTALQNHLRALRKRRDGLDTLIHNAESTLRQYEGEKTMSDAQKFEGFTQKLVEDNEKAYGKEVRQKYGNAAVEASHAKMLHMTKEQYDAYTALSGRLDDALRRAAATGDASGREAMEAAQLHRDWLLYTWKEYSGEAHRNLADMYVADERFAAYYENITPGGAAFLREAIHNFVDKA